jgi:hypothetical protein
MWKVWLKIDAPERAEVEKWVLELPAEIVNR